MGGIKQGKSLEKVLFSVIKKGRPNVVADKGSVRYGRWSKDGWEWDSDIWAKMDVGWDICIYSLSTYYVPSTVLPAEDKMKHKTWWCPCPAQSECTF